MIGFAFLIVFLASITLVMLIKTWKDIYEIFNDQDQYEDIDDWFN